MYHEIHKMSRNGHSISSISRFLGVNWRTIKKLLSMDDKQYEDYVSNQINRPKELAPYEHFVKTKLDQYPETPAAQIHDWLKEYDENFPEVNPKTVYNFVMWVRQEYHIPKEKIIRDFSPIPELPFGKQAQVDFGEYNMRKSTSGIKKVYFFIMVLSRSRYKYVYFSDTPFTSTLAANAHEKSFEYFQGMPEEVVYDQDKVFIHDENAGDLLLTSIFKKYVNTQKFSTYFCRKADPQSKGKVENVVKYVKQNFLYNRSYYDLETLNDEAIAWLNRTANHLSHGKTKISPREAWIKEKEHLNPYTPVKIIFDEANLYTVRRDNAITYKGNLYSLPKGTWKGKDTKVTVSKIEQKLIIKTPEGSLISQCKICTGKGETISNTDHKRDKSKKIDQLIITVAERFSSPSDAVRYFKDIRSQKPRYIRDQIQRINGCFDLFSEKAVNAALDFCLKENIFSASDFKCVAQKFYQKNDIQQANMDKSPIKKISNGMSNIDHLKPNTSQIIDYESIMSNKN
jgi:hypothetical protein